MGVNALLRKTFRQPLKVDRMMRDAQSFKSERVPKRQDPRADIGQGKGLQTLTSLQFESI